jgi:hypothetical protein
MQAALTLNGGRLINRSINRPRLTRDGSEETAMHLPTDSIPPELKADALETRGTQWGDIAVRYLDLPPGVDFTPLLKGLPHDQCQSPHWGYVLRGSIHLRYANGDEEVAQAGEVFYWPAGHTGWTEEGITFVEFSPASEIKPVLEHVQAQMAG